MIREVIEDCIRSTCFVHAVFDTPPRPRSRRCRRRELLLSQSNTNLLSRRHVSFRTRAIKKSYCILMPSRVNPNFGFFFATPRHIPNICGLRPDPLRTKSRPNLCGRHGVVSHTHVAWRQNPDAIKESNVRGEI